MVYAFIIHTLNLPVGADERHVCRVLYSCTFGSEDTSDGDPVESVSSSDASVPELKIDHRSFKKEQLALVARQVQSEYSFRKSVVIQDQSEQGTGMPAVPGLADDIGQSEIGMFRLAAGDPFQAERIAVWLGLANIGFTLVCEKSENRLLAESTLKLISRYLQEHVQAFTQPAEVLLRGDRVAIIVHQFLPAGRLLFMNHAVIRQLEKEMDNLLRGK